MYDTAAQLHSAYEQRDAYLLILLLAIGLLYLSADRALHELEDFMAAHPGTKHQLDAWKRQRVRCFIHNKQDCSICEGRDK